MSDFRYISLFSGAGGLSEGFDKADFKPVCHVEADKGACYTLKTRIAYHHLKSINQFDKYVDYLKGKLSRCELYSFVPVKLLEKIINLPIGSKFNGQIHKKIHQKLNGKEVDLIIGGPPCQAYSLIGRARSSDGMKSDIRNYLYVHYAKYLEKYQPKLFVFENVIGLKSAKGGRYLSNMKNLFKKKGYETVLFTLEANNFGVLQKRKRIILIGTRKDIKIEIPNLESIGNHSKNKVNDIFSDLPELKAGEGVNKFLTYKKNANGYLQNSAIRNGIDVLTQHIARPHTLQDRKIYKIAVKKWNKNKTRLNYKDLPASLKTHNNEKSFLDRFKVVASNEPYAQTVVAHIAKDGHYYIHPDIKQNRSITVREAARLQSFPDDYYFEGIRENNNRTSAFTQIGNAVPPLMAFEIATLIKENLCQIN